MFKFNRITALCLPFLAGVAVAAPVDLVPHTFQTGAPAKASEVNANFQSLKEAVEDNRDNISALGVGGLKVYANTQLIGYLLDGGIAEVHTLNTRGYTLVLDWDGSFNRYYSHNVYFANTNCQGATYVDYGGIAAPTYGEVWVIPGSGGWALHPLTSKVQVTANSHLTGEGACINAVWTGELHPITPNDQSVTGVPDAGFGQRINFGVLN